MLAVHQDPRVKIKFESYPHKVKTKLEHLRALVLEVARDHDAITEIEETLKWGEPSYLVKKGSTVRMDWKAKTPDQYRMYFSCSTKLVATFRVLYADQFHFEKNRAIVFSMNDTIPVMALKECIELALTYHQVKDLPLLGK